MTDSLVQPLFNGPLDIVGDVHGEIEPLRSLMRHLGYDEQGRHPHHRHLVFVGDLTDRGPESPSVVHLVQQLIEAGRAQCVLGNHDLNILLGHRKNDNTWFFPDEQLDQERPTSPLATADETTRRQILDFFRTLPIALERDDLRVVHACWHDEMIEIARQSRDVVSLYHEHHQLIEAGFPGLDLDDVARQLEHQNKNPVKKLTSGPEKRIDTPREVDGKGRGEKRVSWWNQYDGRFCLFGHYSIPDGVPRGNRASFCVDYGVGKRWTERQTGKSTQFHWKLAALRWPEQVVVFDEGTSKRIP